MRRHASLIFFTIMTLGNALADDTITVHHLDTDLRPARKTSWSVGGTLLGAPQVARNGEIVALVQASKGPHLAKWTPRSDETFRQPVDVSGKIVASRLSMDGTLILVTTTTVVQVGADGRILARRLLNLPISEAIGVKAAPSGTWVAFKDRVVYVRMEWEPIIAQVPIGRKEPTLRLLGMAVSQNGDCAIAEGKYQWFELKGNSSGDTTLQIVFTIFDTQGQIHGQRTVGELHTEREWFWSEKEPSNPTSFPTAFGIMRTRHFGETRLDALVDAANGDFLALTGQTLTRYDRQLNPIWVRTIEGTPPVALSPPWTPGLLLASGEHYAFVFDQKGGSEKQAPARIPEDPRPNLSRGAIGQDHDQWIVVLY